MNAQTAYTRETNPIRKAAMKQPNPQAEEAHVKAIFGPENQFVNWVGTLQFSVYRHPSPFVSFQTATAAHIIEPRGGVYDQDAIEILKGISPVAWRNVNLIGNFDFTTGSSPVDIEALAERYENPDFWRRSLQEADDDGPAY